MLFAEFDLSPLSQAVTTGVLIGSLPLAAAVLYLAWVLKKKLPDPPSRHVADEFQLPPRKDRL